MLTSAVVLLTALVGIGMMVLPEPARTFATWAIVPLGVLSVLLQWREQRPIRELARLVVSLGLVGALPFVVMAIFSEHLAGRLLVGAVAVVFLLAGQVGLVLSARSRGKSD